MMKRISLLSVDPDAARACTVSLLWVMCCVPPPVSKLNDASLGVGFPPLLLEP